MPNTRWLSINWRCGLATLQGENYFLITDFEISFFAILFNTLQGENYFLITDFLR